MPGSLQGWKLGVQQCASLGSGCAQVLETREEKRQSIDVAGEGRILIMLKAIRPLGIYKDPTKINGKFYETIFFLLALGIV